MANSELPMGLPRGEDLSERLLDFAVRVYKLCKALPKDPFSRRSAGHLFQASTSSDSNYEEARGAESLDDFIHKMGVVWKELKESRFWLRFIYRTEMIKPSLANPLLQESEELCRIFGSSITTAKKRSKGKL